MVLLPILFSGLIFILSRIMHRSQELYDFSAYEYPVARAE
jgi:hypothetical protein